MISDAETLTKMYEQMLLIRRTEKAAHDLFMAGLVKGTTHLAAGHEAVAVGASAALRDDDYVFATYRGHHHAMARGATAESLQALEAHGRSAECDGRGHGKRRGDGGDRREPPGERTGGTHLCLRWGTTLEASRRVAIVPRVVNAPPLLPITPASRK